MAKTNSIVEIDLLDYLIRQDLNQSAPRRMVVLNPLKVVITNYPEGQVDMLEAINNPEDESAGTRMVPFSKEFYIEQDDFMEEPYRKFYRLSPGREVRLRYAYFVTCTDVIKDESRRDRRTPLHLRPGHQGRGRAGWPQGQGHVALGLRRPCRGRRDPQL